MSKISKRAKDFRSMGDHHSFLNRIQKTLYYSKLPNTDPLSLPVTELASELFSEPRAGRSLDRLHCTDAAHISRQACVSPCSFVLAVLYLERLKVCNPDYLQCVAPSELFLVSLMVSSKFLHDFGEDDEVFMDEWAASGKITVKELIILEREFLNAIQWEIFVSEDTFWAKLAALERSLAKKQGTKRGFFTYTEISNLLSHTDPNTLINFLSSLIAVLITTYVAGVLTILGSIFIVSNIPGSCLHPSTQTSVKQSDIFLGDKTTEELDVTHPMKKSLDAADVLKTSILLASIKSSNYDTNMSQNTNDNSESISWDWWSSSTMNWLSKSSENIEILEYIPNFTKYTYDVFIDMTIAGTKKLDLEDQLHEGTKIRLQDHLEQSWHKEWTDSIATFLFPPKPFSCFQEIKA